MNELKIIFRLEKIDLREFYEQTFDKQLKITMRNKREKIEK